MKWSELRAKIADLTLSDDADVIIESDGNWNDIRSVYVDSDGDLRISDEPEEKTDESMDYPFAENH